MVCISTVAEYNLLKEMGLYFLTLLSFEIDYTGFMLPTVKEVTYEWEKFTLVMQNAYNCVKYPRVWLQKFQRFRVVTN